MSSIIEAEYVLRMRSLSAKQRVERSVAMFAWAREMIARQILSEDGPMSSEQLKWEVAMRQYGADPISREFITRKLTNVSG